MGLVAHWRLEGNAKDSFGEYNGFEVGGPNYSSGKIGNCYDNTGNNAEGIELIRDDDFGEYEDLYSFSMFFKSTTTSGGGGARLISRDASEYPTVIIRQDESSPQELYFYEATNDAGNVVDVNEWYHLVFTIDTGRNNSQLFLDGELIDSGGVNDNTSARPYVIGGNTEGDGNVSGNSFIGKIDDVRLYDHILSAKEVKQLSRGKILHYKFDKAGAYDSAGYIENGEVNGATHVTDSAVGSGAYDFNGSNGIRVKNSPNVQITGDLTISFWAKPFNIDSPSRQNPIHKDYEDEYTMTMETGGDLSYYFNDSDSNYNNYQANNMFQSDNKWVHVTAVRDVGNSVVWYRNGEHYETKSWNGGNPIAGGDDLIIGDGYTNYYNGILDDIRFYTTALDENAVKEIYQQRASIDSGGNFHTRQLSESTNSAEITPEGETVFDSFSEIGPAPSSLVGWWKLDGSTDEHSGKSGDASPEVGSPSIVGGFGQSAYRFDESGSGDRLEANLNRPTNTEITASAWIFPNSSADERAPIVRADRFYFQHYDDDSLATYWYGSQNNGYHYSDAGSVPINVWSHVVATWDDSGNINFYANGDKINTVTGVGGGPRDELDSIRIGQESSGRRFNGKIQDVRIYDRALTSKEVEILYNLTDPEQKQQVIIDEDSTMMTKNQFSDIT